MAWAQGRDIGILDDDSDHVRKVSGVKGQTMSERSVGSLLAPSVDNHKSAGTPLF